MGKIRVGVIGVGNCFAGLAQGIEIYKRKEIQKLGLMHEKIGGYGTDDLEFVSAFDVGENKVGKPLNEAIFQDPNYVNWVDSASNCTSRTVKESPILDGVGVYVASMINPIKQTKTEKELEKEAIKEIETTNTQVLINYLPVGSQKAVEYLGKHRPQNRLRLHKLHARLHCIHRKLAKKIRKRRITYCGR